MKIIGIDNGLTGAVCMLENGCRPFIARTPTLKTRKVIYNPVEMFRVLVGMRGNVPQTEVHCFLEEVRALPKQSSQSGLSIGYGFGLWTMALTAAGIPFEIVRVRDWQKYFSIYGKGEETKRAAYLIAKQMYPYLNFKTERGKVLDGNVDSLLIAEHGRRKLT